MEPTTQPNPFSTPDDSERAKMEEFAAVQPKQHVFLRTPEAIRESMDQRRQEETQRAEALELVLSYAHDLVNMWPTVTIRTLSRVTDKIKALKEALELAKR